MMLQKRSSITVPSVLAADDDYDNLFLISYLIEALNCKCYGLIDSIKVLVLATAKIPDLILLDIVMPDISGFEIISQLQSNLLTQNIPIIAATGLSGLYYQEKIISAGFNDYICKPFAIDEFECKLSKYLNLYLVQAAA